MRLLKLLIISIVVFFLLFTALGSLFPSTVVVSRAINIAADADSIASYISNYDKWNEWMEGAKASELKVLSKDNVKAFYGTIIITLLEYKNHTWTHEWKGRSTPQISTLRIISSGKTSTVAWKFEEHLKWYPWQKLGSIMNDKIIGSSMEVSLDNLKKLAEHPR